MRNFIRGCAIALLVLGLYPGGGFAIDYDRPIVPQGETCNALMAGTSTGSVQMASEAKIEEARTLLGLVLKKEANDSVVLGVVNLAAQFRFPLKTTIDRFEEINLLAKKRRENGIDEAFVLGLTQVSLQHRIDPIQIVDDFAALDSLGRNQIHVPQLTALSHVRAMNQVTPSELMDRFNEIDRIGKIAREDFLLNDQALTILTHASFFYKTTARETVDQFFAVHRLGMNLLGTALLAAASYRYQMEPAKVTARFFETREALEEVGLKNINDENLARLVHYSLEFKLNVKALAHFLDHADKLDGSIEKILLERALTILTYALLEARRTGTDPKVLGDLDFVKAAQLPFLQHSSPLDSLRDTTTIVAEDSSYVAFVPQRQQRLEKERQRRYERRRRWGWLWSWLSFFQHQPSGESSGIGMTYDSDGLKGTYRLGSGMSLDLSDGSLKIGVGNRFSFDTDGDGIGYRF